MIEQEKIIRLEFYSTTGVFLFTIFNHFSFPYKTSDRNRQNLMIIKLKKLPILPRDSYIEIIAYMKSGDRISYPSLVEVSIEGQLNLSVAFDKARILTERRRYYKVDCDIDCRLLFITRDDKRADFNPPISAKIRNINLGGILLTLPNPLSLKQDDTVALEVPNMMGIKMDFNIKILRLQLDSDESVSGFGCCFVYLNLKQEHTLAKYINNLQIEKRKLERLK